MSLPNSKVVSMIGTLRMVPNKIAVRSAIFFADTFFAFNFIWQHLYQSLFELLFGVVHSDYSLLYFGGDKLSY
jgi:hypothetical protein